MIKNMKNIKQNLSEAKHVFLNCAHVYLNSSQIGFPPQLPIVFHRSSSFLLSLNTEAISTLLLPFFTFTRLLEIYPFHNIFQNNS